jgi:hypothetical protein
VSDFKNSDGRLLAASSLPTVRQVQLRITKIKVLEIAWSYLYSAREREAWSALADMWPLADLDRIHAAIVSARIDDIGAKVGCRAHLAVYFNRSPEAFSRLDVVHCSSERGNFLKSGWPAQTIKNGDHRRLV